MTYSSLITDIEAAQWSTDKLKQLFEHLRCNTVRCDYDTDTTGTSTSSASYIAIPGCDITLTLGADDIALLICTCTISSSQTTDVAWFAVERNGTVLGDGFKRSKDQIAGGNTADTNTVTTVLLRTTDGAGTFNYVWNISRSSGSGVIYIDNASMAGIVIPQGLVAAL